MGRLRVDLRRRRLGDPGVRRRRAAAAAARRTTSSRCTPLHQAVLDALADGQALFFRVAVRPGRAPTDDAALAAAIWDLVWAGQLTNDTLAPLRALLGGSGAHRARPAPAAHPVPPPGSGGAAEPQRPADDGRAAGPGCPSATLDPTRRAAALADLLLERHGVVTRGAVMAEGVTGGFAAVYPVLAALEERGRGPAGLLRRGAGRGAVRGARCGGPAAGARRAGRAGRGGPGRRRWCWPPPTRPTRTVRRCPGRSGWSTAGTASRAGDRAPGRAQGRGAGGAGRR